MKTFKKVNSKILGWLTALVLAVVTLFAGANVAYAPKANAADTTTYTDTQVEAVNFFQGGKVIFAFRLTTCDYAEYQEVPGEFPEGTPKYDYITSLSYWKNFKEMNSEGVSFNQLFAYWNGGHGDSQIGLSRGANAVAHQSSLQRLEYGFMVMIPAGTTFPSLAYVAGNCQGDPVAYKTTTDAAFAYNGTEFVQIEYAIAVGRMDAVETVNSVDYSLYAQAEQKQVSELVEATEAKLATCFNLVDVQSAMEDFNKALSEIKTLEYYAQLNSKKAEAKQTLATYFAELSESAYGEAEWAFINVIKAESDALIDGVMDMQGLEEVLVGIQYKVDEVLTEEEKPAFAQFIAAAVKSVEDAFDASLYREAEATQGAALVEEAKAALEQAVSYGEAEALELSYIAKIEALKTAAELTAEEEANKKEEIKVPTQSEAPEQSTDDTTDDASDKQGLMAKLGCGSTVVETLVVIGMALAFTLILILKNKKRMDI